jgi:integrase
LEEGAGGHGPISFSKSGQTRQADHFGEEVRKAWKTTLKNAKVAYFPIYHLRHVFCTRLSWVAPDAIVQRAMRHSSPETKRHYQLGMVEQVRQNIEKANEKVYGRREVLHSYDSPPAVKREEEIAVGK